MATLYKELKKEDIDDTNAVKINVTGNIATSFSRDFKSSNSIYHHLGIYAYKCEFLKKFVKYEQSKNEIRESLEQLRALDNGHQIKVFKSSSSISFGIDTEEDLIRANEIIK
jgi:3-deoxy-manno-octulosonate cytidylyltransferase (CMP-KDO synthetase)